MSKSTFADWWPIGGALLIIAGDALGPLRAVARKDQLIIYLLAWAVFELRDIRLHNAKRDR